MRLNLTGRAAIAINRTTQARAAARWVAAQSACLNLCRSWLQTGGVNRNAELLLCLRAY